MDLSHRSTFSTSALAAAEAAMSPRRPSPGRDPRACVLWLIHPWEHPLHEGLTVRTNTRRSHKSWKCRRREFRSHPPPHRHYKDIMEQYRSPSKIIKGTIIRSRNQSFEFMYKGDKMTMPRRYLQFHIYCHILRKNQDRKTGQCPQADKSIKKMWCIHTFVPTGIWPT